MNVETLRRWVVGLHTGVIRMRERKVTVTDIARHVGVSVSTVSYALSGARPVKPETKAKIKRAMAELEYQPNLNARSLASRRTKVLALVYPSLEPDVGPTLSGFVRAAANRARQRGFNLVLWPFLRSQEREICNLARQGMADGILLLEVAMEDSRVEALEEARIPFVMIGRTSQLRGRNYVDIDFEKTMADAVTYVYGLGCRNIAFVNHSETNLSQGYAPIIRAEGAFRERCEGLGAFGRSYLCGESPVAGRALARKIVNDVPNIDAILVMNEMAALGLVPEIQAIGKRIPQDVSVVAVASSIAAAHMVLPTLTTYIAPSEALGALAVDTLLERLEEPHANSEGSLVPCVFFGGDSSAARENEDISD